MRQLLGGFLILLAMGCKERYDSPVHSPDTGYLVVDGVVNSGSGNTTLTLSRTTKFSDTASLVYETGAIVQLQGSDGTSYTLPEQLPGRYTADNLNLNNSTKYRLLINTTKGKDYISDYAEVRTNPAIDSISWRPENNGIQLYINTHDPQNATRYYQWFYDETWEFHSSFTAVLKYYSVTDKGEIKYHAGYRDSTTYSYNPDIITCWQYNVPTNLFLGSTAKLSSDVVFLPLAFIPHASIKLGVLYSMHLKQYSWTAEGYAFLEKMKKNTESTGSVFDPQPSELKGNISCVTDPTEPVIGYFSICPVQEKRIYIRNSDVPGWGYSKGCTEIQIENISDSIIKKGLDLQPTSIQKTDPGGGIAIFSAAPPTCVDCTLTGSNIKPSYWP